jgi:hypothetical protein
MHVYLLNRSHSLSDWQESKNAALGSHNVLSALCVPAKKCIALFKAHSCKLTFGHMQDGADAVQQQAAIAGMQTENLAAAQPSSSGAASNSARKSSEPPAQVMTSTEQPDVV